MAKHTKNHDLVDSLYAVAMEPERFRELIDIWQMKLDNVNGSSFPSLPDDFQFLKRHLSRAETILSLMTDNEDMLPKPLQEKLNAEPQAMLALTADGIIEALNPAAGSLFNVCEKTSISDLPVTAEAIKVIKNEVKRLSLGNDDETPMLFRIARDADHPPLLITFSRWETSGARRFILLKTTDFIWPDYLTPLMEEAFGLTGAETAVVKLIVEGSTVEDIANSRGTSIKTVRFQIRSIYAKTSTKSQSEFIRMAIGLTTLHLVEKDVITGAYQKSTIESPPAYPLPEHRRLLSLPDGRILDYAIFGPKDGKPCVFFHNEYFGDVWPQELAKNAIKQGLRIILPARPYYGRSSPYPKNVINYDQFTEDMDALLSHLNISRTVYIFQTSGGMFSLASAMKRNDKVVAMVGIAPALPFGSPKDEAKMPKLTRFVYNVVVRQPQMLKFVAKSGGIYHNRVGSRKFLETLIAQSEPDIEIINDPKNVDAIIQGFQHSATNGYQAFYNDYRHIIDDPWQKVLDLACPLYALIGTQDKNSRARRADRLIKTGANIKKIMAEGGGEMLFFSHPELVVDTLVEAWANA